MTRGAWGHARHLTEDRLHRPAHLAAALARRALCRGGAGLRSRSVALSALRRARHFDCALGAEHGFLEGDLDVHAQVVAALRPCMRATATAAAEEHVEEVERRVEGEVA